MDYKAAFEKLVSQIKLETGWAEEQLKSDSKLDDNYGVVRYDRGMLFAYRSIGELADKLEKGEWFES